MKRRMRDPSGNRRQGVEVKVHSKMEAERVEMICGMWRGLKEGKEESTNTGSDDQCSQHPAFVATKLFKKYIFY